MPLGFHWGLLGMSPRAVNGNGESLLTLAAMDNATNTRSIATSMLVKVISVLMLGLMPSTAGTRAKTTGHWEQD